VRSLSEPRAGIGAITTFAARGASAVMGAVVTILLTHSFSKSAFGTYSVGMTLTQLGNRVSEGGMSSVLTRELIAHPARENSLLKWGARLRACYGLLVAVLLTVLAAFLVPDPKSVVGIGLFLATLPLLAFTVGLDALGRRFHLGTVSALILWQSILWLAMVAVVCATQPGLLTLGLAYLTSTAITGATVFAVVRRRLDFSRQQRLGRADAWEHLRDSIPLGLGALLILAYGKVDGVLLYSLTGPERSADYALAYRLFDQLTILPVSLAAVYGPLVNYQIAQGIALNDLIQRWIRLSLTISLPVSLLTAAYAGDVVPLIFGNAYRGSARLLTVLAITFPLICLGWPSTGTAIALRRSGTQLAIASLGLLVNVACNLAFIPKFGAIAAAYTTLATEAVVVSAMFIAIRSKAGLQAIPSSTWAPLGFITLLSAIGVRLLDYRLGIPLVVALWIVLGRRLHAYGPGDFRMSTLRSAQRP
jgi:O-antigen/teichoic acid export membrane protein